MHNSIGEMMALGIQSYTSLEDDLRKLIEKMFPNYQIPSIVLQIYDKLFNSINGNMFAANFLYN